MLQCMKEQVLVMEINVGNVYKYVSQKSPRILKMFLFKELDSGYCSN